ncbi:uncharacterized protein (TIGR02594 family) [Neisseria sp. HSC-16F19]|nr:TIGR02594 family protein [Neisseria sp. HSC-16F19]MCP2041535.1 uncharacterized protein (TIGR02594 family) [Neisseria sp. HSC-16F19]
MNELPWIAEARKHIGLHEKVNGRSNPVILQWLKNMGQYSNEHRAWWAESDTPWCGLFVGHVLGVCGRYVTKNWFRASAWNDTAMTKLTKPAYGCIVTFTRTGGGHVGFVVGQDKAGRLLVLGGNQGNRVSIAAFDKSRVTGYWWPGIWDKANKQAVKSVPAAGRYTLPVGSAAVSRSEA